MRVFDLIIGCERVSWCEFSVYVELVVIASVFYSESICLRYLDN